MSRVSEDCPKTCPCCDEDIDQSNLDFVIKKNSVSLFISIREICQRRKNDNKETYLAFLDFKKAYDSVPMGNILYKLDVIGIRGKC